MCSPSVMKMVAEGADAVLPADCGCAETDRPAAAPAPLVVGTRVADLTHAFGEDFPVLEPIVLRPRIQQIATIEGEEFNANKLEIDEHTGTHVDGPAHLVDGPIHTDEIPVDKLIAPLCVIRIAERAAKDHDTTLTADDILAWESRNGRIPPGALVVMDSGWAGRIAVPGAYVNRDEGGTPHFPGLGFDACELLVAERSIVAAGTDTTSMDAAKNLEAGDPRAHKIVLGEQRYGVENIANLDAVPDVGATAVVGLIRHKRGFAGPVRLFAFY